MGLGDLESIVWEPVAPTRPAGGIWMSDAVQLPNSKPGRFDCFTGEVPSEGREGRHWTAAGLQLHTVERLKTLCMADYALLQ